MVFHGIVIFVKNTLYLLSLHILKKTHIFAVNFYIISGFNVQVVTIGIEIETLPLLM